MEIVCSLKFLLLIFQSLHYSDSHFSVSFEHLKFTTEIKEDKITLSCIIQENQSDSGESLNVDILGLIISRRNQNHLETLAELFKTQPEQVYVSDSGITDAKGSITNDTYLSVMLDNTEKLIFVEHRCHVILKDNNNEGDIQVIFKKLSSEIYSCKNRNDNDAVNFLPIQPNADVSDGASSESNENLFLGKDQTCQTVSG